jgi:two-component system CheB/CheR fusion protein
MLVEREGAIHRVECTIEPITPLPGESRLWLVSFRDVPTAPAVEVRADDSEKPLLRQLEAENQNLREELQVTLEQLESTSEEYRAGHEELLSLNEELQSSNEELQASKEELQSLNEEMLTVNRQLEDRNAELRSISNDLENLITSTEIPIIFLDRELRVRRFTAAATQVMRLVPSDVGRSIEHIKERAQDTGLLRDAQVVLETLIPVTTEILTEEARWYARTVRPYRTADDRIEGICIAFVEVTNQKLAAAQHEDARRSAEAIVQAVQSFEARDRERSSLRSWQSGVGHPAPAAASRAHSSRSRGGARLRSRAGIRAPRPTCHADPCPPHEPR